jgi:ABC-type antimicrobial peptide transport system permease subunit
MFDLDFVYGDPKNAFSDLQSVIIAEKVAKRYFDDENPIGKVININDRKFLTVTGVFKNPPEKSLVRHELIGRFDYLVESRDNKEHWGNHRFRTMILVNPTANMELLNQKMSDFFQLQLPDEKIGIGTLRLDKARLYTIDGKNQRIQYVYLFAAIAIFIILIACINFMNLSTARASRRSKEIGLRKVVGSSRLKIIVQFLLESILFVFISIFLAMMLVELLRPLFNQLTNKQIIIDYTDIRVYAKLLVLLFVTGVLAGSYPAFLMSSFKPVLAIKNVIHLGVRGILFRKILVIIQFTISIFLIISTCFIFLQMRSIKQKDLGFDKNNVVMFEADGSIRTNFQAFRNEILSHKGVISLTRATQPPNDIENIFRNQEYQGENGLETATFGAGTIDFDYFETMKMEIVEGRSFSREFGKDSANVILNQKAIEMMGIKNPIGRSFSFDSDNPGNIVGVVKDFNSRPLTEDVEPVMFIIFPQWCRTVFVRINENMVKETLAHIEEVYKEFAPNNPFEYTFLDDYVMRQYGSEQNVGTLSAIFAFIAIIISCLGLFGLAAYTADQKSKEIGIRKVFGAESSGIIQKISASFAIWVIISNIIAWPLAWLVMDNWLKNFAYRIDLYWWVFILAGIVSILIALLTVGIQVAKVARKNPIDALRYE